MIFPLFQGCLMRWTIWHDLSSVSLTRSLYMVPKAPGMTDDLPKGRKYVPCSHYLLVSLRLAGFFVRGGTQDLPVGISLGKAMHAYIPWQLCCACLDVGCVEASPR